MLRLLSSPLFATEREVHNIAATLSKILKGDAPLPLIAGKKDYDLFDVWWDEVPRDFEIGEQNGVAILSIYGTIYKYFYWYGMDIYSAVLEKLYADSDVKAIVLRIESGGGEFGGLQLLSETIKKRNKPVIAYCEDYAASAAYGIASSCDLVFANSPMCEIGSIGTYIKLADYDNYFKSLGLNIHNIYASKSEDKNRSYRDALEGNYDKMVEEIDMYNEYFLALIAENRGEKLTKESSEWGTGKIYFAPQALELGLIDGIDTLDNVINNLIV